MVSREVLRMWVNHSVIVYCKFYKEFYKALCNHTFISKLHSASELTSAINKPFACCVYNCSGWLFNEAQDCFACKYLSVYCGIKSFRIRSAFFHSSLQRGSSSSLAVIGMMCVCQGTCMPVSSFSDYCNTHL